MAQADIPEASTLGSLRARSPVPTEIDYSQVDEEAQDGSETESEGGHGIDRDSSPAPVLSSDFEMPSLLELTRRQASGTD